MLENGTSMILDANCLTAYKSVEENFSHYKAPCFFILLESSEAEILKRLDYREKTFDKDITNFSRATKEDYYLYLKKLERNLIPREKIFYTINTELNLDIPVEKLISKIEKYLKMTNKNTT